MRKDSPSHKLYIQEQKKKKRKITIFRFVIGIGFLLLWELAARMEWINSFIFSSPSGILICMKKMIAEGTFFYHFSITIYETIVSFLLVTGIGLLVVVLLWLFPTAAKVLEPYLVMLNSIPKSALAPLLIVWLGANMQTIIVAGISVAVFGNIINLYTAFLKMDEEKIKLIRTLGGGKKHILLKVLLPGSLPVLISNMKVNIGLSLVGVVIGEFLAAKAGLGYLIIYGSQVFQLDLVMMSILILCVVSIVLYKLVNLLEKRLQN